MRVVYRCLMYSVVILKNLHNRQIHVVLPCERFADASLEQNCPKMSLPQRLSGFCF